MSFSSPQFLLFLPAFLALYLLVFRRERLRDGLLLGASYVFYMSWYWEYAGLLLLSTAVDFAVGRRLARETDERVRKRLLVFSVTLNLALLGFFKYFNFFMATGEGAARGIGLDLVLPRHGFLLPIAISFYTFHELSYIIDVYRRRIGSEPSPVKYGIFVSFFPQLVAGPILRAAHFLPQLHRTPRLTLERTGSGMALVFRGLFKKIVLADLLASLGVDAVFANPGLYSSWDLLLALYGYSFQIYNDFSGYSDVAIGVARMVGFDLNPNFNRPYLARNVRDFWSRWHISLSTWLRDYLYIPLGGNRRGPRRARLNLMITMLLGGLWHGAAPNFVLWGAWHGLLLVLSRARIPEAREPSLPVRIGQRILCFNLIVMSWLLFRVGSMADLLAYLGGLSRGTGGTVLHPFYGLVLIIAALSHFAPQRWFDTVSERWAQLPAVVQGCGYAALVLIFTALRVETPAFIYFQF